MMRFRDSLAVLTVMMLALAGCATSTAPRVHHSLIDKPASRPLQQVVLLPVDIEVYELTAGGVREEVPEWSETAEANIRAAVLFTKDDDRGRYVGRRVDSSALTAEERDVLEEHLKLFNVVAFNAILMDRMGYADDARFDYTLGVGLGFLKEKYDVDAGLLVVGQDVVSSAGRKATAFVGALLRVHVPLGHSILIGGLVDFETGDLLWLNHATSTGDTDLRDPESAKAFARILMRGYPGLPAETDAGP